MADYAVASRYDTPKTAFYNYLTIINHNKFIREIIRYGDNKFEKKGS